MIQKINFTSLRGLSSDNNKSNIRLLAGQFGNGFVFEMAKSFDKINKVAADKDVFLKTENVNAKGEDESADTVVMSIVDDKENELAKTYMRYRNFPDKTNGCPILALRYLEHKFCEDFYSFNEKTVCSADETMDKMFEAYA